MKQEIARSALFPNVPDPDGSLPARVDLDVEELDMVEEIYEAYASLEAHHLSQLTSPDPAPWRGIYAEGAGEFREIPDCAIRRQFEILMDEFAPAEG